MSEQLPPGFDWQTSPSERSVPYAGSNEDTPVNPLIRPRANLPEAVGFAEDADNSEFDLDNPYERVELFLANNAADFAKDRKTWRQAVVLQKHLKALPVTGFTQTAAHQPRHSRRKGSTRNSHKQGVGGAMNVTTLFALDHARSFFLTQVKDRLDADRALALVNPEDAGDVLLEKLGLKGNEMNAAGITLTRMYSGMVFAAGVSTHCRLDSLEKFLTDPEVVRPFFDRLKGIAEAPDQREFPGFLEILAVHNEQSPITGTDNILYNALLHATTDDILLEDFVRSQLFESDSTHETISTQMKAAAGITQLIFKIDHPELSRSVAFEQLMAARESWPEWLNEQFRVYKTGRIKHEWDSVNTALRPHINWGRANQLQLAPEKVKTPKGGAAAFHKLHAEQVANTQKIIADALRDAAEPEEEPAPVEQFVFLKNAGTGSDSRVLTFDRIVENLDEALGHTVFRDYLGRHREDKTLESQLRQALEILVKDPYCHLYTCKYLSGTFTISGQPGKYTARRFSFQRFPGSGKIARQSRLYYALLAIDGKDTLAFLSFKNKNEGNSNLPLA